MSRGRSGLAIEPQCGPRENKMAYDFGSLVFTPAVKAPDSTKMMPKARKSSMVHTGTSHAVDEVV
jgi:hypothetical protein